MEQRGIAGNRKKIYQVALLQSLVQGYYDGVVKVGELKRRGDAGIGTFEGVNGEMIVLDGKVYQALGDGSVREADDDETVPFSVVTFFEKDITAELPKTNCIGNLNDTLTGIVNENGKNLFYMVRIDGTFAGMNVRSVPKQKKPYRTLDQALASDQKVFNYKNVTGTIIGLYCPDYMGGINTPGWHSHFISDDRTKGGHILDLAFDSAHAELSAAQGFEMYLPDDRDFQAMELSKDVSAAIRKVETNE
ncbi:MAG: acetolactate decarboxylase [Clostridia bacterium]|nr:acetolactate decarboxylase [Clostridia bacterium]